MTMLSKVVSITIFIHMQWVMFTHSNHFDQAFGGSGMEHCFLGHRGGGNSIGTRKLRNHVVVKPKTAQMFISDLAFMLGSGIMTHAQPKYTTFVKEDSK